MIDLRFEATELLYRAGWGFCEIGYKLADKLEEFGYNIQVDEDVAASLPIKYTEKKRKTKKPFQRVSGCYPLKKLRLSKNQIKVNTVLDGFDDKYLQTAKKRITAACNFITHNAETRLEKNITVQLVKMFREGALIITDTYLTGNKRIGAYFQPEQTTGKALSKGFPHIGLDIMTVINNDDAYLVNILAHEAYHAWRFYTGDTEYSIIDETRAWNVGLHFSNKYRAMNDIPVEREKDYTIEELDEMGQEYRNAFNVNLRIGPGESLIEKIGYGIANFIEDIADTIDGWTDRIIEKI